LPLLLLGFSTEAIAAYSLVYFWQAHLIHANIRLNYRPLRYVFVSPAFRHWHHSREQEARDKNFAGCFAFFDLIFASLYLPKARKPDLYGIDSPMPEGYLSLFAHPFLALLRLRKTRA
jgi:sterol desaturase/sphingolipid hydroxylase (fatty acid hydroxylase superfamily)